PPPIIRHPAPPRRRRARLARAMPPRIDGTASASPPASPVALDGHGEVAEDVPPGNGGSESVEALAGRTFIPPAATTAWTKEDAAAAKQASLRVYLGAAPGVGKTFAMLGEGQRRRSRGTDVVVGIVQTYERPKTIEMLEGLEVLPPRLIEYRGTTFEEMDLEA